MIQLCIVLGMSDGVRRESEVVGQVGRGSNAVEMGRDFEAVGRTVGGESGAGGRAALGLERTLDCTSIS